MCSSNMMTISSSDNQNSNCISKNLSENTIHAMFSISIFICSIARVDRLQRDTCPYVCPQTGLN